MSKTVRVGNCVLGGEQIYVQSMLNTLAGDHDAAVTQALALQNAGCDIVRLSIPDLESVKTISILKKTVSMPIVADIHFDYRLALAAIQAGVDKIRINPGNIGSEDRVRAVVNACKEKNVPIRIGVNGGSLEKELLQKYGSPTPEAMVESAMRHVRILERLDFHDIVISIKSSDVKKMIAAYRLLAKQCDYPLHLGVTEAGTTAAGIVKSAVGIGSLLLNGIGDTIRVSLTDDPVKEVDAARLILRACGLDEAFVEVVSCPTCGRCSWESMALADKVTNFVKPYQKKAKIAVMGCVVNGPGEAKDADLGIAGGNGACLIFKKGEPFKKVSAENAEEEFFKEIRLLLDGKQS